MRSGFSLVIATIACFTLAQAHAVEAPDSPVAPVPESPSAAATLYPQVSTPVVLTSGPLTDSQPALPPIEVPMPPSREASTASPQAESEAGKSKSPGG